MPRPAPGAPLLSATFSSLRTRNYRLFFFGQLVSMSGTWMQTVAQSLLVLSLSHSGSVLGLTVAARFGPLFLLGPQGGVIADRMDKQRVLYVTQFLSGVLACAFGVITQLGAMHVWIIYVLAVLLGLVEVFDTPVRQSFIPELVSDGQIGNAVSLNSVSGNLARVLGAAAGGAAAGALGLTLCFYLNAVSFAAVLATLAMMDKSAIRGRPPRPRAKGELRAGLRYVRRSPDLLVPLVMLTVAGTLAWEFQVTVPLIATDTFGGGASTYGIMTAAMGVGAIVGGLTAATRRPTGSRTRLPYAAIGWGLAIDFAALAPTRAVEYVALAFVGYGAITFNSMAKTTLQLAAAPEMRGRVMALWALGWQGSTPIGAPLVGRVGAAFGARFSLLAGGVPCLLMGIAVLAAVAPSRRARRERRAHLQPRVTTAPEAED
ncbi:putative integral membrane efflux protein [Actinacidiphila reveromycinica]|uniref:Putative integral membrane efflux protein n=1 Tax=Actinacidiphila reveromycinica TaxID=659352 RepID=A0A7U3UZB1_9ACTN|nr:MFS transporter [Streptomyces sp. SN-593]BBB01344.1 putative integral membrane efflux protein [Streptomyces sp. SN-593]